MRLSYIICARVAGMLGLVAMLASGSASAQTRERAVFDIFLGDFRVGVFAFSGVEARGRYSVAGQLRSTGLIGALADVRYDAKSQGRIRQGRFVPESYTERGNIGERSTDLVISYKNGVPEAPVFDPPRADASRDLDPSEQGDAIDLMTMLYTLLKDVDGRDVCRYDVFAYDGVRRTRVTMRPETNTADGVTCAAEYRRVAGFSAAEMEERPVFPFRVIYSGLGEGRYRATAMDVETVYGVVRLERRAEELR